MTIYGVLKSSTNTGVDSEIAYPFGVPITIKSNKPAFTGDTLNLKRVSGSQIAQRWEIEANIAVYDHNAAINFMTHSIRWGYNIPIYIRMPSLYQKSITPEGLTLNPSTTYNIGANTLTISNGTSIVLGEFIRFSNHSKIYCVVDVGSPIGTNVIIEPALVTSVTAAQTIAYGKLVTMNAYYDSDTRLGITYEDGILANPGTVRFIEQL